MLIFGLQWLRKSILRASGYKARHDEDLIFQTQAGLPEMMSTRSGEYGL